MFYIIEKIKPRPVTEAGSGLDGKGIRLGNLGLAYKELGEVKKVRDYRQAALAIFLGIKDPTAAKVQQLIDDLDKTGV